MNDTSVEEEEPNHETLMTEMGMNVDIVYGVTAGIALILGLILTFKGKQYFQWLMTITLFIVGAVLPLYFAIYHKKEPTKSDIVNQNWIILGPVSLVCGTIACVITYFFYKVAVFAAGAIGGGLLGNMVMTLVLRMYDHPSSNHIDATNADDDDTFWNEHGEWISIGVYCVCGIIAGAVAIKIMDPALRVLTAFIGSFLTTGSVAYFVEMIVDESLFLSWKNVMSGHHSGFSLWDEYAFWCFVGWGILGIIGLWLQFRERGKEKTVADLWYHDQPKRRETDIYREQRQKMQSMGTEPGHRIKQQTRS